MPQQTRTILAFDQALRLINQHACSGFTIEQILDTVNISRQTLERYFQHHLGRTPGQELVRVRLEHAKTLLAMTRHPMKLIARMVGFRTASSFSAFFRNQTGVSPTAFRQAKDVAENSRVPIAQVIRSTKTQKRILRLENIQNVVTATVN